MSANLSRLELLPVSVDDNSLDNQGSDYQGSDNQGSDNQGSEGGKKSKKGGNGLTDLAVPAVLVLANNMYKKKGGKKSEKKKKGGKKSAKKSKKSAKKSRKSRK